MLEELRNPNYKCRYGCGNPMPLPEMYGKYCSRCGWRQPTLAELFVRVIEPIGRDPDRVQTFDPKLAGPMSDGFVTVNPGGEDEALHVDVFASARRAKERRNNNDDPVDPR